MREERFSGTSTSPNVGQDGSADTDGNTISVERSQFGTTAPRHQRHDALKEFCNRVPIPSGRIVGNTVDRTSTCPACHSDLPLLGPLVNFPPLPRVLNSQGPYRPGQHPGWFPDDVVSAVVTRFTAVFDLLGAFLGRSEAVGRERGRDGTNLLAGR